MKRIFSILFALALVLSFSMVGTTPVAAATTYYVDDSGSDSNGGTSWGDAWLTIQHAVDNVISGDTIMVGAGTYAGAIVDKQVAIVGDAGGGSSFLGSSCFGGSGAEAPPKNDASPSFSSGIGFFPFNNG